MTYCVGMLLDEGLVMAADTRTNAGLDSVGKFKNCIAGQTPTKLYSHCLPLATWRLLKPSSVCSMNTSALQN